MDGMNARAISALADMFQEEQVGGPQQNKPLITPASFGAAPPTAGAIVARTPQPAGAAASKPNANDGDIWDVDEVPEKIDIAFEADSRKRPTYDILYKQSVSAMDAFGAGLTGKTPSSISCNQIVVKIKFPGHKLKDLVRCRSPEHWESCSIIFSQRRRWTEMRARERER